MLKGEFNLWRSHRWCLLPCEEQISVKSLVDVMKRLCSAPTHLWFTHTALNGRLMADLKSKTDGPWTWHHLSNSELPVGEDSVIFLRDEDWWRSPCSVGVVSSVLFESKLIFTLLIKNLNKDRKSTFRATSRMKHSWNFGMCKLFTNPENTSSRFNHYLPKIASQSIL